MWALDGLAEKDAEKRTKLSSSLARCACVESYPYPELAGVRRQGEDGACSSLSWITASFLAGFPASTPALLSPSHPCSPVILFKYESAHATPLLSYSLTSLPSSVPTLSWFQPDSLLLKYARPPITILKKKKKKS